MKIKPELAVELTPEFTTPNPAAWADYLQLFGPERRLGLERWFHVWDGSPESVRSAIMEFRVLADAARNARADLSERLARSIEDLLVAALANLPIDDHGRLGSRAVGAIGVLWELRQAILADRTEKGFWEDEQARMRYAHGVSSLRELCIVYRARRSDGSLASWQGY